MRLLHAFTTTKVVDATDVNADIHNLLQPPDVTEVTIRGGQNGEQFTRSFFKLRDDE